MKLTAMFRQPTTANRTNSPEPRDDILALTDLAPAIELAIARFSEFRTLEEEVDNLAEALETRKKVERAKGILMDQQGMTETEAFRKIQKMSMNTRRPMKEVAEAIILANAE